MFGMANRNKRKWREGPTYASLMKRSLDSPGEQTGRERKRQKINHARNIQTETVVKSSAPSALTPIPSSLDVVKFTDARAFEIQAMQNAMKTVRDAASSRVFQTLPRHLRRRAASHNPRRVPVRLREKAKKEIDPVKRKLLKRILAKAGKHKRQTRTETLLKRQKNKRWLETHIWHAKRMKMIERWGYRLALHPTEKSFRPSHRAAINGCILHDCSYTAIIELKGVKKVLEKVLSGTCSIQDLSAASPRFSKGSRSFNVDLYEDGAYPYGFIAPVQILWRSSTGLQGQKEQSKNVVHNLWILVHPVAYDATSNALTKSVMSVLAAERKAGRPALEIEIADLRGQFNIFDLVGPKSSQVIRGALTAPTSCNDASKRQFWNSLTRLRSPSSCPRSMIVGLTVDDPRLRFPPKNARIDESNFDSSRTAFTVSPSSDLATSDLWDEKVRIGLSRPKFTKKDLDERRAKQTAPGTTLVPSSQDQRVPLVLIQKSIEGAASSGEGTFSNSHSTTGMHGWTLIVPLGWGMPFLSSLIFTGTRVGGLREVKSQANESGLPHFPDDFSGTKFGQESLSQRGKTLRDKWERTPPAKRPSYGKLGVIGAWSPFEPDWDVVCGRTPPSTASTSTSTSEMGMEVDVGFVPTQRSGEEAIEVERQRGGRDDFDIWLLHGPETKELFKLLLASDTPQQRLYDWINDGRTARGLPKLPRLPISDPSNLSSTPIDPEMDAEKLYRGAIILITIAAYDRGVPSDMSVIYDITAEELTACANADTRDEDSDFDESEDEGEGEGKQPRPTVDKKILGYVTSGFSSMMRGKGFGISAVSLSGLVDSMKVQRQWTKSSPSTSASHVPHFLQMREAHGEVYRLVTAELV